MDHSDISYDGDITIIADKYRGKFFENTTKVNIPKALRARSLESPEGERVTVDVYCESCYNVYFINGKIVNVTKPEDLPAGCRFNYYTGNPVKKYHELAFWMIRGFVGRYVKNLLQWGIDVGEYDPGDDSCDYLGYKGTNTYWVKLFDGFYDDEELATAKLDIQSNHSSLISIVEVGSEVVNGVKYNYQIYSTSSRM